MIYYDGYVTFLLCVCIKYWEALHDFQINLYLRLLFLFIMKDRHTKNIIIPVTQFTSYSLVHIEFEGWSTDTFGALVEQSTAAGLRVQSPQWINICKAYE